MVEILRLGIIVVQDNVFISLISTFLRQLGTSSAIDFLDNDGTGFGVCERNVECDIPVYEFYLVCQSVEYMLVGFITDLYTVYAVGQGELRCTVLVGYRLVGIAAEGIPRIRPDRRQSPARCAAGLRKDCLCRGPYILRVRM